MGTHTSNWDRYSFLPPLCILTRSMSSSVDRVNIPLLSQLIPGGIKPGVQFVVEFDPDSQWLSVATTIAARFIIGGGRVAYGAITRSTEAVKEALSQLGVDVAAAVKASHLNIDDWYTATLTGGRIDTGPGRGSVLEPMEGGLRVRSLTVADLSVQWLKDMKEGFKPGDVVETWPAGALGVSESLSELLRFNEENSFVEFFLSRMLPNDRRAKRIGLRGIATGIHSPMLYKRLENALDGVIDVRVLEQNGVPETFLRIRVLKSQPHDNRWYEIEIKSKGEAVLVS